MVGFAPNGLAGGPTSGAETAHTHHDSLLAAPIRFFQEVISPVDGPRCHSYPTCSTYARQAISRHGALIGWIMASDRLMRCGRDDNHQLPRIRVGSHDYADDPVSANDFWWYRP